MGEYTIKILMPYNGRLQFSLAMKEYTRVKFICAQIYLIVQLIIKLFNMFSLFDLQYYY